MELKHIQKEITQSTTLIEEGFLTEIQNQHREVLHYIKSQNIYFYNEKLSNLLRALPSHLLSKKHNELEFEYKKSSNEYIDELENTRVIIKKRNQQLKPFYDGIIAFDKEIRKSKKNYFANSTYLQLKDKYSSTYSFFKKTGPVTQEAKSFLEVYPSLEQLRHKWNIDFVQKELSKKKDYFNDIDGKSLDEQQRKAIVVDEDNNLVVAGAGSGKTLTISGKVKYLVENMRVHPEEILLVTFTKKAAEEMEERIKGRLRIEVETKTFHSIGMSIIGKSTQDRPDVLDDPGKIIKGYFDKELYDDPEQLKRLIEYFGYYLNVPKDLEEFDSLGECYDFYKSVDLKTIKGKYEEGKYIKEVALHLQKEKSTLQGERVKSLEEVMIANYLFLNGIEYIYEKEYEYSTSNEFHRQYKPDFYLPEYDIYIEHFGVTRDNRTPWLSRIEEKKYLDGMTWKRNLHRQNGTNLIESYSYLVKEGTLLDTLHLKLVERGVQFKKVDFIDIFNTLYDHEHANYFNDFIKFVSTFLNLFKSNAYQYEHFDIFLRSVNKVNDFYFNRTNIFLDLVKPIYLHYEKVLKSLNKIDFNDMINKATQVVKSGIIKFPYKYIIIDEYQDISVSRFRLIEAIRSLTQAKIMAVGDDWQSIYRFAGSDLNLFTNFSWYFGYSELMKIEKTYRNSQQLIDIAGKFIMENPKQIKKELTSRKQNQKPILLHGYLGKEELVSALVHAIEQIVDKHGEKAEIMLLGRNNYDVKIVNQFADFKLKSEEGIEKVIYRRYPKLNMYFLTAHRSKGLEADNVIIINARNNLSGFPNRIADDPILSLVLTDQDEFLFAEERRLFYVALTRTRKTTYILVPVLEESVFVKEISEYKNVFFEAVSKEASFGHNPKCPRCIEGYLVIRENSNSKSQFIGCSNFPQCDYTLKDVRVLNDQVICPSCKGYMVIRKGPRGDFYGCVNYPDYCKKTKDISNILHENK